MNNTILKNNLLANYSADLLEFSGLYFVIKNSIKSKTSSCLSGGTKWICCVTKSMVFTAYPSIDLINYYYS